MLPDLGLLCIVSRIVGKIAEFLESKRRTIGQTIELTFVKLTDEIESPGCLIRLE